MGTGLASISTNTSLFSINPGHPLRPNSSAAALGGRGEEGARAESVHDSHVAVDPKTRTVVDDTTSEAVSRATTPENEGMSAGEARPKKRVGPLSMVKVPADKETCRKSISDNDLEEDSQEDSGYLEYLHNKHSGRFH